MGLDLTVTQKMQQAILRRNRALLFLFLVTCLAALLVSGRKHKPSRMPSTRPSIAPVTVGPSAHDAEYYDYVAEIYYDKAAYDYAAADRDKNKGERKSALYNAQQDKEFAESLEERADELG
jgi:hypothetical protein